jgi:hypothetical protein
VSERTEPGAFMQRVQTGGAFSLLPVRRLFVNLTLSGLLRIHQRQTNLFFQERT